MNPIFSQLFFMMALAVPSQAVQDIPGVASVEAISIRGISIFSPRSKVISAFGKPKHISRGRDKEMGTGRWEKMKFPGLTIDVTMPEKGFLTNPPKEPYVFKMVITGNRWHTKSGLIIGESRDRAISKLGPPSSEEEKEGTSILHYQTKGFDGFLWVQIRNNKVVEIGVAEDWT